MTPFGFRVVCFEPLSCNIIQALNILFINIFLNSPYSETGKGGSFLFRIEVLCYLSIKYLQTVETKRGLCKRKLEWYFRLFIFLVLVLK